MTFSGMDSTSASDLLNEVRAAARLYCASPEEHTRFEEIFLMALYTLTGWMPEKPEQGANSR